MSTILSALLLMPIYTNYQSFFFNNIEEDHQQRKYQISTIMLLLLQSLHKS